MGKKIPLRQCVGCREMKTKKEMIRVIKTPENEVVLDAKGKQMAEWSISLFFCGSVIPESKTFKRTGTFFKDFHS